MKGLHSQIEIDTIKLQIYVLDVFVPQEYNYSVPSVLIPRSCDAIFLIRLYYTGLYTTREMMWKKILVILLAVCTSGHISGGMYSIHLRLLLIYYSSKPPPYVM